jgi:hypothetical protein
MTAKSMTPMDPYAPATSEDVTRTLGALNDMTITQILAAKPSLRDISDAALWHRGDGDLIAREHRELTAGAQAVIDILEITEEELAVDER